MSDIANMLENRDSEYDEARGGSDPDDIHEKGLKAYWKTHSTSIDGLPSLTCFATGKKLEHIPPPPKPGGKPKGAAGHSLVADKDQDKANSVAKARLLSTLGGTPSMVACFVAGMAIATAANRLAGLIG
jgi:hypothetical protein